MPIIIGWDFMPRKIYKIIKKFDNITMFYIFLSNSLLRVHEIGSNVIFCFEHGELINMVVKVTRLASDFIARKME